ncbi:MAG: DNA methyltransferase [Ignavibacteriae bacterium HGW-Ignavibacteriae-1]|nr:MAG: DNA methyltransferase [Ignavibacteriae bacterium HGW-Ignavibacteriae-1]
MRATRDEKLDFLRDNPIRKVPFDHIIPDKNNNWINLSVNDWEAMIPIANKETKFNKSISNDTAIFKNYTLGIVSNRDDWVYDYDKLNLRNKIQYFIEYYNLKLSNFNEIISSEKSIVIEDRKKLADYLGTHIKFTREFINNDFLKNKKIEFDAKKIKSINYRPFVKLCCYLDFDHRIIHEPYQNRKFFNLSNDINKIINFNVNSKDYRILASDYVSDLHFIGDNQCFPLYFMSNNEVIDNITDWGLEQFHNNYTDQTITKEDIFHYVYAVLHNQAYRKKYEMNLKREFPRVPFYDDFWKWADWGKKLMDLHINFETATEFPLKVTTIELKNEVYKPKLKADKDSGTIELDNITTLSGVPKEAWEYKLGNRSALEWILDQYKEKKPKDPTIAEKFNTYRFADYKDKVIDLLMRVTTVSVETVKIVKEMGR